MPSDLDHLTVVLPRAQANAVRSHARRLGVPVSTAIHLALVDAVLARPLRANDG